MTKNEEPKVHYRKMTTLYTIADFTIFIYDKYVYENYYVITSNPPFLCHYVRKDRAERHDLKSRFMLFFSHFLLTPLI